MSSLEDQRVDRAKEVLVRWMGGENLDIAALEMERLVHEYVAYATSKGYKNGYETAEEQLEW